MIVLREAVRFVSDVLKQPQRRGVATQAEWLDFARAVNLFLALGE